MLDKNIEFFVIYMSSLSLRSKIIIHPTQKAQIALLLTKKVTNSAKFTDFASIFLKKLVEVLPKRVKINKYAIKLEDIK